MPVVPTVATSGAGVQQLIKAIRSLPAAKADSARRVDYGGDMEQAIARIEGLLDDGHPLGRRIHALMLLQGDAEHRRRLTETAGPAATEVLAETCWQLCMSLHQTPYHQMAVAVRAEALRVLDGVASFAPDSPSPRMSQRLGDWLMNPWIGLPTLAAVLYLRAVPVRRLLRRRRAGERHGDALRAAYQPMRARAPPMRSSPGRQDGTCWPGSSASSRWACATRWRSSCRSWARSSWPSPSWRTAATCRAWRC